MQSSDIAAPAVTRHWRARCLIGALGLADRLAVRDDGGAHEERTVSCDSCESVL